MLNDHFEFNWLIGAFMRIVQWWWSFLSIRRWRSFCIAGQKCIVSICCVINLRAILSLSDKSSYTTELTQIDVVSYEKQGRVWQPVGFLIFAMYRVSQKKPTIREAHNFSFTFSIYKYIPHFKNNKNWFLLQLKDFQNGFHFGAGAFSYGFCIFNDLFFAVYGRSKKDQIVWLRCNVEEG